ncbi:MAG TPA: HD domain-containing protein [Pirellulales bacterium]|nr:HD domain-containing protein [Pirellulales bacterium]
MPIHDLPEIASLESRQGLVRIPPELDVPLTPRVQRIIDTAAFRRLAHISQLGLVPLVYPAANHTRFEHSLGVYRLALLFLQQLSRDERFVAAIDAATAERFIAAALLHDIGHWPFCHPIEDIRLAEVPSHESLAAGYLVEGEIADALETDWQIDPHDLANLLSAKSRPALGSRVLSSMLSGPIDVDKMDYLQRDSLHAGVPYGRNFDQQRLIGSLCLNEAGDGLAITDKGKTAAEMMVFARYVMFSEVYWHHAVRSATAMLQRAFYEARTRLDLPRLFRLTEPKLIADLQKNAEGTPAADLLDGLFGSTRRLYKRLAGYSLFEEPRIYQRFTRRPYPWLVGCAERFAELATAAIGESIAPHEILIDAPPVEREIEFDFEVYFRKEDCYRRLRDISPVVRTLAKEQFDDYVKRVRVFAHPRVVEPLRRTPNIDDLIDAAINQTPSET